MINFDNLDLEEQELLDSFVPDEWISVLTPERLIELQSDAMTTLKERKTQLKDEDNER